MAGFLVLGRWNIVRGVRHAFDRERLQSLTVFAFHVTSAVTECRVHEGFSNNRLSLTH
jgi:hypothetical protein